METREERNRFTRDAFALSATRARGGASLKQTIVVSTLTLGLVLHPRIYMQDTTER